jgi:hypothetical protein
MIRAALALALVCSAVLALGPVLALGGGDEEPEKEKSPSVTEPEKDQEEKGGNVIKGPRRTAERVENLQEELDSLLEDVEDLWEPIEEFDLFDQCMYLIGVTEYGTRDGSGPGYFFNGTRKTALALDIRGFRESQFQFLSFPGEEPPSIECNEDAEEEIIDR